MWSRQLRRFLKGNGRTLYSLLVLLLIILLFFFLFGYLTSSTYLVMEEMYNEIKEVSKRPLSEHLKMSAVNDDEKPIMIGNGDRLIGDETMSRKTQFNADHFRDMRSWKDVPIDRNQMAKFKDVKINGEPYPRLTIDGKFVPIRRWVHLDLKGAPFRESYFVQLFPFIKRLNVNGVVIEWEDMFPYTGKLASARNGNAYSMDAVRRILKAAKESGLEVVPLVQTIGHLEWVLKLKEFSHLRDDAKFPQVICVGSAEAWSLLNEMIEQVAKVHAEFGMNYFHMGADEVFQIGVCTETMKVMEREGDHNRLLLWHLVRVAAFLKNKYLVTVLAWHDMLERVSEEDLINYNAVNLLEPVLWSYAEDLEQYLSPFTWAALKPFKKVWGGSVYKGADGPLRYSSNPIHYIRNQESWIAQFTRVYPEFELVQGLILSGWSRYDHLAALCETFPVGVPSLAIGVETVLAGRPLDGNNPISNDILKCQAPYTPGYAFGCDFPGHRVYELINEFHAQHEMLSKYRTTDYEFNGWLSALTEKYPVSSPMYIQKIMPFMDYYLLPMEKLEEELRAEMSKIFFNDTYDEFHLTYMAEDLQFLRTKKRVATNLLAQKHFAKRPFVKGT